MTSQLTQPVWITRDTELADACEHWADAEFLALDTEFVRTTTFYPKPGLIQLATTEECWLIDPLSITDWEPFRVLMRNPAVIKVFHSCAEDLEVCKRLFNELPDPLFDTQLAMAFAGHGHSVGFQRALSELLQVDIPKEATRSDWLKRPLSPDQVEYAVADVYYLRRIYPLLRDELVAQNRLSWLEEDCQRLLSDSRTTDDDFRDSYRRVKLGWKLRPQEQYILQQLSIWREHEARRRDVPRNKVADDRSLWNMARYKSSSKQELHKAGLPPHIYREAAEQLLDIISAALQADESQWPVMLDRPLSVEDGNRLKALKEIVNQRAEALQLPSELLASKRLLTPLARSDSDEIPSGLQDGWRRDAVGTALFDWLQHN
ncbi:MAG: ribonuclease D [Oceanospirillaceae bacterium]|nr:ribonuclease D [Oceanospirillaceae bacterium]|tara:strand:+ start:1713 stop:2837 length:1125 start_codon:yes stop_codon:yes gene_type:complete